MNNIRFLLIFILIVACKNNKKPQIDEIETEPQVQEIKAPEPVKEPVLKSFDGLADTTFVRLADFSDDFLYDMRYATENNFLKAKVYDCPECYTRVKTAKALIAANQDFIAKGYKIKFFDCYRPNSVQFKMWEILPNPQYVANPVKGSIHNKGGAVDITLATIEGKELDMGTEFDFFGKRAHHDHMDLPQEILDNRKLLKDGMESHGFWGIRTEWWHYNLSDAHKEAIADFKWECE